jgi:hypothetical protein
MSNTHVYKEKIIVERPAMASGPVIRSQYNPASRVIYFLLDVVEILLALRFVLRLLSANSVNAFTNFIYSVTAPLIAPFRGIFPTTSASGAIVEWTTVVAMILYALIAYAIVRLIDFAETPTQNSF